MAAYRRVYDFMTHVTCRLTAKNRLQLRNPMRSAIEYGLPSLPTKWRSYRDHRLCGVTSRGSASAQLVARIVAADAGCRISGCRRDASDRATSVRLAMMENLVRPALLSDCAVQRHARKSMRRDRGTRSPPVQSCKSMGNRGTRSPPSTVV